MSRLALIAGLISVLVAGSARASSHREAPFVTEHPKVDGTDFYMFRSYETGRQDFVTLLVNYIPLQDAYGGPNFFSLDPEALYEIHIDNTADGVEDLTFQFRFTTTLRDIKLPIGDPGSQMMVSIPLYNAGVIAPGDETALNIQEAYSIDLVRGNRRTGTRSTVTSTGALSKPADKVGPKSIPNYEAYARSHIHNIDIPGCDGSGARVFVGQRKEAFTVNLDQAFDLVNIVLLDLQGQTDINAQTCNDRLSRNKLGAKNVTTIALEVPTACLTNGSEPVIGAWSSASVRQARVLNRAGTFATPAKEGGAWTQVSRLGHPLVNELVVGLPDKDAFNASTPSQDASRFMTYFTHPTLPNLINILFGSAAGADLEPKVFPRVDLISVFLTGVTGINRPMGPVVNAEELRLNTSIAIRPLANQNTLGVFGSDNAGYPNGRRPVDDVVDVALRAMGGALLSPSAMAPLRTVPLTDCAPTSIANSDDVFPYLQTPN